MCIKTENQEVAFYMKCKKEARSRGYSQEVIDDFPSWAYTYMKAGRRAPIENLLTDYLRTTYGVTGSEGQKMRREVQKASCNGEALESFASEAKLPSDNLLNEDLWNLIEGDDRVVLELYFKFGFTKKEIGEKFGLTEGRISQKMTEVLAEVKARMSEY